MRSPHLVLIVVVFIGASAGVPAQNLVAWEPTTGLVDEATCISPAYPGGGVPLAPFPLGVLPPLPVPFGGTAMDNTTGIVWASDGLTVLAGNYPFYPVIASVPPPGTWPWPFPVGLGPVHGMTIDPVGASPAGVPAMWVTDGVMMVPMALPPLVPVGPPVPLDVAAGGPLPVAFPPLTGLDWDPLSGTFWAVDTGGVTYNFAIGAFLGFGPPAPPGPAPAMGIALDRSGGTVVPGLYVAWPGIVIEQFSGIPTPIPAIPIPAGLSFHAVPSILPGASPCAGATVGFMPNAQAFAGNGAFGLTITGTAPGMPLLLAVDGAPLVPPVPFGTGALHLDPFFSPGFSILALGPAPGGGLFLPLPLAGVGPRVVAFGQVIQGCGGPEWIALSDGLQLVTALP